MGRYRKIDTRTWNDQKFNELSDYGKLVFFLLLSHPHLTSIGAMRATLPGLAEELHWPFKKFKNAFDESYFRKMVHYDDLASFMWLPNFLKYNKPESPNVIRSWEHVLDYLPECSLKDLLISHLKSYVQNLPFSFQEALPKAFQKSMPNQEQEQKQEQEKKILSGKPDDVCDKSFVENQKSLFRSQAIEILNFLNEKTGKAFRLKNANINLIVARLKSGATVTQCRQIIVKKNREWKGNAKSAVWIRPATLFNEDNFEQYIGELVISQVEGDTNE